MSEKLGMSTSKGFYESVPKADYATNADDATNAEFAAFANEAAIAKRADADKFGNVIHETYGNFSRQFLDVTSDVKLSAGTYQFIVYSETHMNRPASVILTVSDEEWLDGVQSMSIPRKDRMDWYLNVIAGEGSKPELRAWYFDETDSKYKNLIVSNPDIFKYRKIS